MQKAMKLRPLYHELIMYLGGVLICGLFTSRISTMLAGNFLGSDALAADSMASILLSLSSLVLAIVLLILLMCKVKPLITALVLTGVEVTLLALLFLFGPQMLRSQGYPIEIIPMVTQVAHIQPIGALVGVGIAAGLGLLLRRCPAWVYLLVCFGVEMLAVAVMVVMTTVFYLGLTGIAVGEGLVQPIPYIMFAFALNRSPRSVVEGPTQRPVKQRPLYHELVMYLGGSVLPGTTILAMIQNNVMAGFGTSMLAGYAVAGEVMGMFSMALPVVLLILLMCKAKPLVTALVLLGVEQLAVAAMLFMGNGMMSLFTSDYAVMQRAVIILRVKGLFALAGMGIFAGLGVLMRRCPAWVYLLVCAGVQLLAIGALMVGSALGGYVVVGGMNALLQPALIMFAFALNRSPRSVVIEPEKLVA